MKKLGVILLGLLFSAPVLAQEVEGNEVVDSTLIFEDGKGSPNEIEVGYSPLSVRPIHSSDIMWKKIVTRKIDLREKQNTPLFAQNWEFSRLLVDAVKAGKIQAYLPNDSLNRKMTRIEFDASLVPGGWTAPDANMIEMWRNDGKSEEEITALSLPPSPFTMRQLYVIEMKENIVFDKHRSVLYYDPMMITIFLPMGADPNIPYEKPLFTVEYKELYNKVLKNNPKARWFNVSNSQQHKQLADAFDLRLFGSYITKVDNPYDVNLTAIEGGDKFRGILASEWAAMEIMEYEHNLWEF